MTWLKKRRQLVSLSTRRVLCAEARVQRLCQVFRTTVSLIAFATVGMALTTTLACRSRPTGRAREAATLSAYSGSYAANFCSGECADSSTLSARGTLVLFDSTISLGRLTSRARQVALRNFGAVRRQDSLPNACYILRPGDSSRQSTVSNLSFSFTTWVADTGGVEFLLFRSPEAGYTVSARLRGDSLIGHGVHWQPDRRLVDVFTAQRVGDADVETCLRAAERYAATYPWPAGQN
jgi:hypothetical protein